MNSTIRHKAPPWILFTIIVLATFLPIIACRDYLNDQHPSKDKEMSALISATNDINYAKSVCCQPKDPFTHNYGIRLKGNHFKALDFAGLCEDRAVRLYKHMNTDYARRLEIYLVKDGVASQPW